jgi:hypothetical protein
MSTELLNRFGEKRRADKTGHKKAGTNFFRPGFPFMRLDL